jgi:transcriptional regulator GlxA family with amidase domain
VLVIPSGSGSLAQDPKNVRVVTWIKEIARTAKYVTSHCEGAFLLGSAGLLDNRNATTFHSDRSDLQKRYQMCRVIGDKRIVVDGNLITSAGGLASYEGSLLVVEKLFGTEQARTIATALVFGPSNEESLKEAAGGAQ